MPQEESAQLWKLNHLLLSAVMNACADRLGELGLETKEFFVLEEVRFYPYPAELATRLMLPKASVTVYLKNLVAKGMIERTIDEADLRRHRLTTTAKGQEILAEALDTLAKEYSVMLERLDAEEQAEFRRILLKLVDDQ